MNVQRATIPADSRTAPSAAWWLCGLALVLLAFSAALGILNDTHAGDLAFLVSVVSCAVVGGMVASRRSTNPVGWFFLASALSFATTMLTSEYARYGLLTEPGALPLARAMVWPATWLWVPGAVLILVFVPLYFPDGRLVSRRWRPVALFAIFFTVLVAALAALEPGEIEESGLINPLGMELPQPVAAVFEAVILPLWLGLLFVSAASLVVRFRRSGREERQQIKWLAFAAVLIPVWFLVNSPVQRAFPNLFLVIDALALAGVPIAAGIAILKYRLYDIDLVINRTLVYGALTACVVGLYVLVVGYLGALLRTEGNLAISLVATGVVAVLFQPLRDRLQRAVNRLMYGERAEPYAVLSRLGQRLEATLDPRAVLPAVVETVVGALKVPHAGISLKRGGGFETAAQHGTPSGDPLVLPLTYQNETVGRLTVSPRAKNEPFTPADTRLLEDLARQAGVAAYAVRLTADLQRSREKLVAAREEERRRLRRDLHDGVGPRLAALTLKIETARNRLAGDAQTEDLLSDLAERARAAVADVRTSVHALRPPALDELGLVPAIRETAAQYGGNGLRVTLEAPEDLPPLPAAVEVAAYRIAQEAMTNVVRHARASSCAVRFEFDAGAGLLRLAVEDDGRGIGESPAAGVGLSSMCERAEELGGWCAVEPAAGGGTRVRAELPVQAPLENGNAGAQA